MVVVFLLAALLASAFATASAAQADEPDEDELRKIKELIAQQRGDDHVNLPYNDKLALPYDPKDGIFTTEIYCKIDDALPEFPNTLRPCSPSASWSPSASSMPSRTSVAVSSTLAQR